MFQMPERMPMTLATTINHHDDKIVVDAAVSAAIVKSAFG